MWEIIGMTRNEDPALATHKELRSSQILKSEKNVANVIDVTNFINHFTTEDSDTLYCIASGAPSPKKVEQDLLHADDKGKKAHAAFVKDHLVDKKKASTSLSKKDKNVCKFGKTCQSLFCIEKHEGNYC